MELDDLSAQSLDGYAGLKSKLLGLLYELQDHLGESKAQMIEDEINAASAFAEWKIAVEREGIELVNEREQCVNNVARLDVLIAQATDACGQCYSELALLSAAATDAQDNYNDAENTYNGRVGDKRDEYALFGEVIRKYENMAADLTE